MFSCLNTNLVLRMGKETTCESTTLSLILTTKEVICYVMRAKFWERPFCFRDYNNEGMKHSQHILWKSINFWM